MTPLFFALPNSELTCERLAIELHGERGYTQLRRFPDGETYVRIETDPRGRPAMIVGTLSRPDDKIAPLLFLADTLRGLGASSVGLVAPYLAYMRQDARFHPGEAVTSRTFASVVSRAVDWLVTVDPHLHRVHDLSAIYSIPTTVVHTAADVGRWIAANVRDPFIIGPDEESAQWVDAIAASARASSTVLAKTRRGDTDVVESVPRLDAHLECTPVLVDDIISTGQTMLAAVRHLQERNSAAPVCVGVHAVFADGAYGMLQRSGARRVVTTNTIAHPSNGIDVVPALAAALRARDRDRDRND